MRGAPERCHIHGGHGGIIPADAGSTKTYLDSKQAFNDYAEGSSPRMRGAPFSSLWPRSIGGIIPADAGSTLRNPCNPNNIIDKISIF